MFVRTAVDVLCLGSVLIGKALVATGLRSVPGGWRRVVGVGLRGEATKFAVSAFGLRVPPANLGPELQRFLEEEPHARFRLNHRRWVTSRIATKHVDVVVQRFALDGSLAGLEPHLSQAQPVTLGAVAQQHVHLAIVEAYNHTRHLGERERPESLLRELHLPGAAGEYARRLLDACCVSVEAVTGRFTPPEFRLRRNLGFGFLTLVVRPVENSSTVDVWLVAHHTGADGVPMQELATNLERAWGTEPVVFPEADAPTVGPRPCHLPGEREVYETLTFLDFGPLLALRKRLNTQLPEEITVGALLQWLLSREPEFAATKYASTVDVAPKNGFERDVDLVVIRPADFPDTLDGLTAYVREVNRLIGAGRARTSPVQDATRTAELLSPWLHRKALELNPERVKATFGAVGLSVMRDAKVFVAPMADVGYADGFLALGSVTLPTADGRCVGAVSIKGTREQVERYPAVVRRMLAHCDSDAARNDVTGAPVGFVANRV